MPVYQAVKGEIIQRASPQGLGTKYKVGKTDPRTGEQKYYDPYGKVVTHKQIKHLPKQLPSGFTSKYVYAREIEPYTPIPSDVVKAKEEYKKQQKPFLKTKKFIILSLKVLKKKNQDLALLKTFSKKKRERRMNVSLLNI